MATPDFPPIHWFELSADPTPALSVSIHKSPRTGVTADLPYPLERFVESHFGQDMPPQ